MGLKQDLDFYENTPWYLGKDGMTNPWLFFSLFTGIGPGILGIIIYRRIMAWRLRKRLQMQSY
jgi:hypothetical protein